MTCLHRHVPLTGSCSGVGVSNTDLVVGKTTKYRCEWPQSWPDCMVTQLSWQFLFTYLFLLTYLLT